MPSFSLGALEATTDAVPVGSSICSACVSGTFTGTVVIERRATPSAAWEQMARDTTGTAISFTAPSGAFPLWEVDQEPEAQIRARMSAYTSGTATVRLGR
jgi:hypothetical protein